MRLNHSDVVLDFEGNQVKASPDPADPTMVTFRSLAMSALGSAGQNTPAEKKARIFALSARFHRGKFIKLTVDEASLLKDVAGEGLTPFGYGRLCEWMEGEPQVVASDGDDDTDEPA